MHIDKSIKIKTIGIRRENKGIWEGRVPLIPQDISILIRETSVKFIVQPCTRRAIRDEEFKKVGALISNDLSQCDLIIGVKEIPIEQLENEKSYLCFSHTHKGQSHNMPFLREAINRKITLLDYELFKDEISGERLVAYGQYAGISGMINCLHGLGYRLLQRGYRTPFVNIAPSNNYLNLDEAIRAITLVGKEIARHGLACPTPLPLVFCFTGNGNVSKGAQSIFKLLPHVMIEPNDSIPKDALIVGMICKAEHCMINPQTGKFDSEMFLKEPSKLASVFAEKIGKRINVLINGIYWESKYPRLLSNKDMAEILPPPLQDNIYSIADISCDVQGSIEFTNKVTTIDDPFFIYDPQSKSELTKSDPRGIQILAVDNLPAQLPLNSSQYFSTRLLSIMKTIILEGLDHSLISKATIVKNGKLMISELKDKLNLDFSSSLQNSSDLSNAAHLDRNKDGNGNGKVIEGNGREICIFGSGHVVGPVIDYLSKLSNISNIKIGTDNPQEAHLMIKNIIERGKNESNNSKIEERECKKGEFKTMKMANISIHKIDATNPREINEFIENGSLVISLVPAPLHVTIAKECIKNQIHMITASYISQEMMQLDHEAKRANILILNEVGLDPGLDHISALDLIDRIHSEGEGNEIIEFTSWCGGLPAPEYANNPFRYKFSWNPKGALMASQNMATFLENGQKITIPGRDLMKSMRSLNDLHPIMKFEGYPNRDSLKYIQIYQLKKIKTMIRGTLRYEGFAKMIDGFRELGFFDNDKSYQNHYCHRPNDQNIINFKKNSKGGNGNKSGKQLINDNGNIMEEIMFEYTKNVIGSIPDLDYLSKRFNDNKIFAKEVNEAMIWLNMLSREKNELLKINESSTILDIFCQILQRKLLLASNERDLIFMAHGFTVSSPNGKQKKFKSYLMEMGDKKEKEREKTESIRKEGMAGMASEMREMNHEKGYSAMAKTVGYPVAIAAKLIIDGVIKGERGVIGPMTPSIYRPMLEELKGIPIQFTEEIIE